MKPYETIKVNGKEYPLKITTANAVRLEEELGTDVLSGMEKLAEIKTLAKYYFYAAVSQNDDINKIEDIYSLIDDYIAEGGTIDKLQRLVMDILLVSGILTEEVHEASKKAMKMQETALQKLLQ